MQDSTLWHSLRAENIGGSEVADLFNCGFGSHYQLWHTKAGNMEADDLSGNEAVQSGNFLEAGIRDWANWKWSDDFYDPRAYYRHATVRGMGCTPDGISQADSSRICQLKNISHGVFSDQWISEGDFIIEAPLKYMLQCQHEISCLDAQENDLIACVGGKALKKITVFRDDKTIGIIQEAITNFWRSIENGLPPDPDFQADGPVIQELRRRQNIYAEPIDWSRNNRAYEVVTRYLDAAERISQAEEDKRAATSELLFMAGNGKRFEMPGFGKVTIVDVAAAPGTLITEDMVGTHINARNASSYPKVTPAKESD